METYQSTGIQIHLTTGDKPMFYQELPELVAKICNDLDGRIFTRTSLIIESGEHITTFPGHAMIGITILIDVLPDGFLQREKDSNITISQISEESFHLRRLGYMAKVEGQKGTSLCELQFVSGERLFLEFIEVAVSGMGERTELHHLFAHPSLSCRRLEGGFSIWNTAHIVSWSHYPKIEVPINSWPAESLAGHARSEGKRAKVL